MSWIILEGLDRTGKSSVAKLYEQRGFRLFHFSAPDDKYTDPDYVGPSYFEDMMELYVQLSGQDIVFDRSIYGELVWPQVYGRDALLAEEEIEELLEMENQNLCQHILMYDKNVKAHWDRCVKNNEPLDQAQFNLARKLFFEMADKYGFGKKTISDFGIHPGQEIEGSNEIDTDGNGNSTTKNESANSSVGGRSAKNTGKKGRDANQKDTAKQRLDRANAIDKVLSTKIVKNKGKAFEEVESEIRSFLEDRMAELLGGTPVGFTQEEVSILKLYVKRLKKLEQEKRK